MRHALVERDCDRIALHVAGEAAFRIAGKIEVEIDGRTILQTAEIDAGLAQPLHRHQEHHRTRPLRACRRTIGAAEGRAFAAARQVCALGAPFTRERAHDGGRHAGLALLPFRRLGRRTVLAEKMCAPFVEAGRARRDIILVVELFVDPDMHDRLRERGIRAWPDLDPLAAEEGGRRIEIRVDVDHLDPDLFRPETADRAFQAGIAAGRRLGVGRPEHHQFAILEAVLELSIGLGRAVAHRIAVMVHGAPVPALPAVGIDDHLGRADRIVEPEQRAEVVAEIAPGMVRGMAGEDRAIAVLRLHPPDFGSDDIERLVPGDALVAGNAAILRIARTVRIEVDPLHRIEQSVLRIDGRFVGKTVRTDARLRRRRKSPAARGNTPAPLRRFLDFELDRRHADDLCVLHIDEDRPAIRVVDIARLAVRKVLAERPMRGHHKARDFREPARCFVLADDVQFEHLDGVDVVEMPHRRREQAQARLGILEQQPHVGPVRRPRAARNTPA